MGLSMTLLANLTLVILSGLLGFRLLSRYRSRPRAYTLWYGVGLLLTAAAAFPEVWQQVFGSLPTALWWLYWTAASATVGFLGVGTAYLLSPLVGRVALTVAAGLSLWLLTATIFSGGPAPTLFTESTFAKAPTAGVKWPFVIQSSLGALLIFSVALWSLFRTRHLSNLWIALGTLLFAVGGTASGLLERWELLNFANAGGIILLYVGVTQAAGMGRFRKADATLPYPDTSRQ